ncbi:uncharacterized protein UHO2_01002 [Ustilago hordei]|uniref:uncharacterized protein n=1 Tax=Ustilago hordei TaxID=120017 RepID=UPI001A45DADB|nr:uncharacterized protein UHO2_01002 [Ustilago hordei]SYW74137.1 uncharacterized protein UHO2_01002 [Ustilago hordei]
MKEVSWAWMLKKQEGHWFIWKEHRRTEPYARRAKHSHEEDQAQGAGTAMKRTKLKEHADGYHSGAREEQGRQVLRRRISVEGVNITQEAQGCQTSRVARRRSSVEGVDTVQEGQGYQAGRRGP